MATTLDDLDQFFSPGLVLTVRGKKYTVPLPDGELGLWCQLIAQAAGAVGSAVTDQEMQAAVARVNALPQLAGDLTLPQRVLGATYGEMIADKVPWPFMEFCGATAFFWIVSGEPAAERYWRAGGRPEALRPTNRQERRAQQQRTGGSRTAEATGTQSPGNGSGTKSRRRSRRSGGAGTTERSPGSRS